MPALVNYLADEIGILEASEQTMPHDSADHESHDKTPASLVKIQDGQNPPLFFVPGVIGFVFNFYPLASYLPGQAFYALQTPGLDGEMEPYTTISEIAAHHIKAIQAVQPEGPYLLGGHSGGAKIAMEILNQLVSQGHDVSLMAILDVARNASSERFAAASQGDAAYLISLADELERTYSKKLQIWLDVLLCLSPEQQMAYFLKQLKKADLTIAESEIRRIFQIYKINTACEIQYVIPPKVYSTKMMLFMAEDTHPLNLYAANEEDSIWGWHQLFSEPVEAHVTPGDHYTMLMEPHVQVLAQQIQKFLDNVQRKSDI